MFHILLILQVLLGLGIIGLVLLQQGKGADMGAAFGSGSSGTVFGARGGGSFFTRMTAVLAAAFFINSVLLSSPLVIERGDTAASVTDQVSAPAASEPPVSEEAPVIDMPPADLPEVPALDEQGAAAGQEPAPADDLPE